jgi:hypothetical protein
MKTHNVGKDLKRRERKQRDPRVNPPTIGVGADGMLGRGSGNGTRIGAPDEGAGELGERIVANLSVRSGPGDCGGFDDATPGEDGAD